MNCLNCDTEFNAQFCPNCGQRSGIDRINFKSFTDSLVSGFTDANKGILFNLKNLTLKPAATINGFLDGKRKHVFNPVSYLLVAITLYLLASEYLGLGAKTDLPESLENLKQGAGYKLGQRTGTHIAHHIKFFYLLNAVYFGFFTRLFFKKRNLFEHIIINAFIVGHATLIGLLFYPIFKFPIIFNPIIYIAVIILHIATFKKYSSLFETIISSVFTIFISLLLQIFIPVFVLLIIDSFK